MNAKELKKNVGALFRFRPLPWRLDVHGHRLKDRDDTWRLDDVVVSPAKIRLINTVTGHVVELESDNVIERRSPDFLLLRCQLKLTANGLDIDPMFRGSPLMPTSPMSTPVVSPPLSADEETLLRFIAAEDGAVSLHTESHTDAGLSRIRHEEALSSLLARQFLVRVMNSYETRLFPRLSLTATGRRWVIENGLA